jgi:hypothetical protein
LPSEMVCTAEHSVMPYSSFTLTYISSNSLQCRAVRSAVQCCADYPDSECGRIESRPTAPFVAHERM